MYGKVMSMKDELIPHYFELCTFVSSEELEEIKNHLRNKRINPRELKKRLAREIVSIYYNKKTAESAEKEFEKVFKKKELPTDIPKVKIKGRILSILDLLVKAELAPSKSEAKRLILQKGVKINGKVQNNWQEKIEIKKGTIIQVGKRKFAKIN